MPIDLLKSTNRQPIDLFEAKRKAENGLYAIPPTPQPLPPPTQQEQLAKESTDYGFNTLANTATESGKDLFSLGKRTLEPFIAPPYQMSKVVTDPIAEAIQQRSWDATKQIPSKIEDNLVNMGLGMGESMGKPLGFSGYDAFKESWSTDPYGSAIGIAPIVAPIIARGVGEISARIPKKEPVISPETRQAYTSGIQEIGQTLKDIPDEARPAQARIVADIRNQMRSALFKNDVATINSIVDDFREGQVIPTTQQPKPVLNIPAQIQQPQTREVPLPEGETPLVPQQDIAVQPPEIKRIPGVIRKPKDLLAPQAEPVVEQQRPQQLHTQVVPRETVMPEIEKNNESQLHKEQPLIKQSIPTETPKERIRAYHGTAVDFDYFDRDYLSSSSVGGAGTKDAWFFSENKEMAEYWGKQARYSKGQKDVPPIIKEVLLNAKNPLKFDFENYTLDEDGYKIYGDVEGVRDGNEIEDVIKYAKKKGHDLVQFENIKDTEDMRPDNVIAVLDDDIIEEMQSPAIRREFLHNNTPVTKIEAKSIIAQSQQDYSPKAIKQHKEYLFDQIDEAIKDARDYEVSPVSTSEYESALSKEKETSDKLREAGNAVGFVTIEVPGDGKFKIINSTQALTKFKNDVVAKFPTIKISNKTIPSKTPTKGITGDKAIGLDNMMEGTYKNQPIHSDGNILLFSEPKIKPKAGATIVPFGNRNIDDLISKEPHYNVDDIVFTVKTPEEIEGVSDMPIPSLSQDTPLVELYAGDKYTTIKQKYYNYVKAHFPDAKFKINGMNDAVQVFSNKKLVGFVMPIEDHIPTKFRNEPYPSGNAHPETEDNLKKIFELQWDKREEALSQLPPKELNTIAERLNITKGKRNKQAFIKYIASEINRHAGYNVLNPERKYIPSGNAHPTTSAMPELPQAEPIPESSLPAENKPEEYIFELPELVEFVDMLEKGKYPVVKRALGNALGLFHGIGDTGKISIKAELAKNDRLSRKVLSHELAHWIGYIPQNTLRRGNILGHVASLIKYFNHAIDKIPTDDSKVITEAVRNDLKRQAVLNIRNSGEKPDNFWHAVKDEYNKLITKKKEEVGKYLITKSEVQEELKNVIREFNREFYKTPEELERGIQYFFKKPKEMYADAGAAFVLNPKLFKQYAPKTFNFAMRYLENKPKAQMIFKEFRDRVKNWTDEQVAEHRLERGFEMTAKGEEAYRQHLIDKGNKTFGSKVGNIATKLKEEFVDAYSPIYDQIKDIHIKNKVKSAIEDFTYRFSPIEAYYKAAQYESLKPLQDAGIDEKYWAEYVKARRDIHERKDIYNPGGHTPKTSAVTLDIIHKKLGDEKFKLLETAMENFWRVRNEHVIDLMKKNHMYDPELMHEIENNKYYVTYDNIKYIEARYGKEITSHIYKSVGTMGNVANPITATLMKDAAIIKSVLQNTAKREAIQGLISTPGTDVRKAPYKPKAVGTKIIQSPAKPTDSRYELITYMDDGKIEGWHVPKDIAQAFDKNPIAEWAITQGLQKVAQPFREIFTRKRPGFWVFNIIRDPNSAIMVLPKASYHRFLPLMVKAIPKAAKSIKGYLPEVNDMFKRGELITSADTTGMTADDTQFERLLLHGGYRISSKMNPVMRAVDNFGAWLNYVGELSERTTKIAAKDYLEKYYPDMPQADKSRLIRWAGTPALLVKGRATPLVNNLALFSNPFIQGWRIQAEVAKASPIEWSYKTFKYAVLPKALMIAAALGAFGDEIKRMYEKISIYDFINYYVIPIGWARDKVVSLRIPQGEINRFIGGLIAKQFLDIYASGNKFSNIKSLFDYTADQFPGFNPAIKTAIDLTQIARGHVPYDEFRGKPAIQDQRIIDANDMSTVFAYSKYFANNLGIGIAYKFNTDRVDDIRTTLEKVLWYPVASDIIGRFIKVSDGSYGIEGSMMMKGVSDERQGHARVLLRADAAIKKMLVDKIPYAELSDEDQAAYRAAGRDYTSKKIRDYRQMMAGRGNIVEKMSNRARNKQEEHIIRNNAKALRE